MNASQAVNEPQLRKLTCLAEDRQFYAVHSAKDRIIMAVPIQLAVFILNLAKLRLLSFTFDEIDRLDGSDYCKFGTFREDFIFANNVKRHTCDVKTSRLGHGLLISVNERVISPFREDFIFTKLRICEVS